MIELCNKKKGIHNRIDSCMKDEIDAVNSCGYKTVASCCGHGRYSHTIIVRRSDGQVYELATNRLISRKRKFYKTDKKGYYYIPEVDDEKR